jgi:hypothetical protein
MDDPYFDTPLPVDTHRDACTSLGASTARELKSAFTVYYSALYVARLLPRVAHSGQLDIGANYSVTAHRSLLMSYTSFQQPIPMESIDASGTPRRCWGKGLYRVTDCHGDPFDIPMWYCPGVSETLISPDHVCRELEHYNIVDSHHDVVQDVGHIRFSSKSGFSVTGTESLDPTLAGSLRVLVAHMPDNDAPVVLPDAPTGPVQHLQTMSEL